MENTIRQFKFLTIPANTTGLRCVSGIYLDLSFTSVFCFVSDEIKKHSPCNIANGFIDATKVIFFHVVNRKIFNDHSVESIYKFSGFLMSKIVSFPANSLVNASNHFAGLYSGLRGFFLSGKFTLSFGKGFFFLPEETGVFDLFPIRQGCKGAKPHIDTDSRPNRLFNRFMLNITGKAYKPFAGRCSPNGTGFDYAFNGPMEFDFNSAYLGKLNYVFEQFKTRLRIGKRIISTLATEARVSRFFTGLYTPKECSGSKVYSCRNILKALAKSIIKKRMLFFKFGDRFALIISGKTFLFRFPRIPTLFQKIIIEPATNIKRMLKLFQLSFVWKNPVFKSFSHGSYTIHIILCNVKKSLKKDSDSSAT